VDTDFAIGSILRLQVPRVRMAKGWALGKFGGEFGQRHADHAAAARVRLAPSIPALLAELLPQAQYHDRVDNQIAEMPIKLAGIH
jgi:hypothetical protein